MFNPRLYVQSLPLPIPVLRYLAIKISQSHCTSTSSVAHLSDLGFHPNHPRQRRPNSSRHIL